MSIPTGGLSTGRLSMTSRSGSGSPCTISGPQFGRDSHIDATLLAVTDAAIKLIEGAKAADILTISARKQFRSQASTSDLPERLDRLQEATLQGAMR